MLPVLCLLLLAHPVVSTLTLCSTQNTGSYLAETSLYMSNGLCHDTCSSVGYAIGIVSDQDCYCSNSVPADTVSLTQCSADCPGYPSEQCAGSGVFGYIEIESPESTVGDATETTESLVAASVVVAQTTTSLSVITTPSSTTDATSTTESSTTASTTTSSTPTTSTTTSSISTTSSRSTTSTSSSTTPTSTSSNSPSSSTTHSSTPASTSTSTSISSSTSSSSSTKSSSSSSSTTSQIIVTSYITSLATITNAQTEMVTAQTTVVVVQTSAATENTSPSNKDSQSSFFDDKAKVAGVFTVVGVACVGIISALVFVCYRFCCGGSIISDDDESEWDVENQNEPKNPFQVDATDANSNTTEDETVIGEKTPRMVSMHKKQMSLVSTDFGTPIIDKNGESSYVDQRLDVGRFEDDLGEVNSLNDGEDYSRKVLKVVNP